MSYCANKVSQLVSQSVSQSHHVPPWHVRHDVVAMATAAAYQRRWNSVHYRTLGPQWQSRDQILKFLKFKRADGRHFGIYWKYHNSPSNGPIGTKLGWSHPITLPTCPPKWGCRGNGRCLATGLATALWTFSSYGRLEAERVNQFW